jgi:uncharacterized protein (TIGR02453 family)
VKGPPKVEFRRFEPTILQFLEELADNNMRVWFQKNKGRYECEVLEPCLAFVRAMKPHLKKVSPFFVASDRRIGGSLMRIYRDTRFTKDKTPYKTNAGIQFRHEFGRDIHAPGFYVHVSPDECFLGVGMWRPDRTSLLRIRKAIAEEPARWRRAKNNRSFRNHFELAGGSLKTAPRGYSVDHPLIEDLRRTDFLGLHDLTEQDVLNDGFVEDTVRSFAASRSFMRFLCRAIEVPF